MIGEQSLELLSDRASAAHAQIQSDFKDINPIIGVNRGMRTAGIPADAMTIDCLVTDRRILLVLHDGLPDAVRLQYTLRNEDPSDEFKVIPLTEVTESALYGWMKDYFSR
ncbi:hypothetical protein [Reinekea marinisedimentorum]|uniref:Uncharacterized protein n=1 Tax=Reinekea marinisedimentorum TaxID=230495 RepID=A0A4R3IAZ8_9GAMM|nr:hypothetical protein [Reinekea marinisedimentorum]TCS43154.1 hypothetical protein BCF53_102180 [Reinekea marinisedimentorum]